MQHLPVSVGAGPQYQHPMTTTTTAQNGDIGATSTNHSNNQDTPGSSLPPGSQPCYAPVSTMDDALLSHSPASHSPSPSGEDTSPEDVLWQVYYGQLRERLRPFELAAVDHIISKGMPRVSR